MKKKTITINAMCYQNKNANPWNDVRVEHLNLLMCYVGPSTVLAFPFLKSTVIRRVETKNVTKITQNLNLCSVEYINELFVVVEGSFLERHMNSTQLSCI